MRWRRRLLLLWAGFPTAVGFLPVDWLAEIACALLPWPIAGFCATANNNNSCAAFCLRTPELRPDVCVNATSSANCPGGWTAADVAERSATDLAGKVALVTGGRSGLGFEIARALLGRGCAVVIASRSDRLNARAVAALRRAVPGADVSHMTFNLEEMDSVRAFASQFRKRYDRLDYYFANAGQVNAFGTSPLTVDGYERVFQVNYVSQILLVELLLPLLRQSLPSSRVLLTASFMHHFACNSLGLGGACFAEDGGAVEKLPFDQSGLDAMDGTFGCYLLLHQGSVYSLTKYLMLQAASQISLQEADLGNQVYAYAWDPGSTFTALNPVGLCCFGPYNNSTNADYSALDEIAYALAAPLLEPDCPIDYPYVGPRDVNGRPDRPLIPLPNYWTSPSHGAMAAVYAALEAKPEEAGTFLSTLRECEPEQGRWDFGITPVVRSHLYNLSKSWAGL